MGKKWEFWKKCEFLGKIIIFSFFFQKICPETGPATIVIISTTLGVPKESNVPLGKTNIYLLIVKHCYFGIKRKKQPKIDTQNPKS